MKPKKGRSTQSAEGSKSVRTNHIRNSRELEMTRCQMGSSNSSII